MAKTTTKNNITDNQDGKQEQFPMPSEMVIKEIMFQKNVDRDTAIYILQHPTQ